MDVVRLLKQDHRRVETLFDQFEALTGLPSDSRTDLIQEICDELTLHIQVEEELVYPVMSEVMEGGEQKVQHAEGEHEQVDQLIDEVLAVDPEGDQIEALMMKLRESVTHHVREEEDETFPSFEKACDEERLEELGTEVEARKQQLLEGEPVWATGDGSASTDGQVRSTDLVDLTKEELYEQAQKANIPGRSKMTKDELVDALGESG